VNLTNPVSTTSIEQNPFGGSGFAGINVRHDAYISGIF
jgi:hypothetical protein